MTCGSCGEKNRDGARFCAECGTVLEHACMTCDAALTPTAKFCDQCGTPVGFTPDDPESSDDGAVRKTVTVMFADLVGSTAFGEAVDAEAARREMGAYHQLAQRVIDRHQGTLVKFIGDGVMAVFGIPEIAEDDADRAIRAGLDLQGEFRTIAAGILERHGATVGLRVGINTGEIVIAEHDDDMVGDAINTAARIEAECTPGRVLVGEQTWRLTRSTVDYEVLGEVHVKGKQEGVATFQVLAATDEEIATPFVGRDNELLRLRAALDDTIDDRTVRLVSVIGAPGVGKTRLAAEMSDRAGEGVTAFDLRVDRAATATFGPIADLLAAAPDAARRAVDAPDAERLLPLLDTFTGSAPARSTEESFWAARRLVELIAADGPTVIVVDDVQWAQPLFLDLLDHLVEWVAGPALIVALARPEIREIRPTLAERGRRVADVISLEGLDAATTEMLAARLLGADELPDGLAVRLPESTEGNPLFVRELVRMLVDDGTIEERNGRWALSIDADAVEVPPTIQSLLASRVERMDDEARRVVEMAAVVGSEFARGAVAALLPDMAHTSLDRILEGLRRREIIDPTGTYWGDEPVLRFHHVLIRDAAYRRLLKERRADLHLKVADWTETMATATGADHDLAIAFHLEQAHRYLGELGPFDDAGLAAGARAADLLAAAANGALQQDDLAAASSLAVRALALIDAEDPHRAEVLVIGCEAFFQAARVNDAEPLLGELTELAGDDRRLDAWATAFRGNRVALTEPDGLVEAEPEVAAAAETLSDLGDDAGVAKARLVRAMILARLGRVGDCETELDAALHAARAADDRRRITAVLGAAPVAALWGPSPVARAGGRCLDIIRLLRITSASPMVEATSIRCQAVLEAMRGRFDEARELAWRSAEIVDELGLRHGVLETEMYRGYIELLADDPAAAEPHLRRAFDGLGQLGVGADAGQAAAHLARALLAQGRLDEAAEVAEQSAALAGQNLQTAIASRSVRAELASRRTDHRTAHRLAEEAVAIAERTDLTMDHARAEVAQATVLRRAGDEAGADAAQSRASELHAAKGAEFGAQLTPSVGDRVTGSQPTANAASELQLEFWAAVRAGDADRAAALVADDWWSVDTRPGHYLDMTKAQLMELFDQIRGIGAGVALTPISVRGDRLVLSRCQSNEDGATHDYLELVELADDGRAARAAFYDHDDLRTALDELTQRYRDGEGAEFAEMVDLGWRLGKASEAPAEDQPALLADVCHDDIVVIDHQPVVGLPDSDLSTLTEQGMLDAGMILVSEYLRIGPGAIVVGLHKHLDGDLVRDQYLLVVMRDGKAARMEWFAAVQREQAAARFDELTSDTTAGDGPRDNGASLLLRRFYDLATKPDQHEAALELVADDWEGDDRRPLVGTSVTKADLAEFHLLGRPPATAPDIEVIDTAGDELAMCSVRTRTDGSDLAMPALFVIETDGERFRSSAVFDIDDRDRAAREFERRRFRREEGAAYVETLDLSWSYRNLFYDLEAFRDLLTDDFELVDHRAVSFGRLNADEYVDVLANAREVAEGRRFDPGPYIAVDHGVILSDTLLSNAEASWPVLMITVYRGDLMERQELFDPADRDRALARFEELRPSRSAVPGELHNRATATMRAFYTAMYDDRDLERARALLHDDLIGVDNRPLVGTDITAGQVPDNFRELLSHEHLDWTLDTLAVAGEWLALSRLEVTRPGSSFTSSYLMVNEVDADGLAVAAWSCEPDDIEAAHAELDRRYRAGEGAEFAPTTGHPPLGELRNPATDNLRAFYAAMFNDRDFDTAMAFMADDFVGEDRRELVGSTVAKPDVFENYRELLEHDGRIDWTVDVLAVAGERVALTHVTTVRSGSSFETEFLLVAEADEAGLATAVVAFGTDDLEAAVDEMTERYIAGEGAPYEEIARVSKALGDARARNDAEASRQLTTDDFVVVDHRAAAFGELDLEGYLTLLRADVEATGDRPMVTRQILAADESMLLCETVSVTDAAEWPMISLLVMRDGRVCRVEVWHPGDHATALARFEELTAESRESRNLVIEMFAQQEEIGPGDFDPREAFSDAVIVDHRSGVIPLGSIEDLAGSVAAFDEQGMGFSTRAIAWRGEFLGLFRMTRSTPSGLRAVMYHLIQVDADRRPTRLETFGEDQLDQSLRRLDELWWDSDEPEFRPFAELLRLFGDRIFAADWAGVRELLDPEFRHVLHKKLEVGPFDLEGFIENGRIWKDMAGSIQPVIQEVVRHTDSVALLRQDLHGLDEAGLESQWSGLVIGVGAGDKITRWEEFEPDAVDAALARFDELARGETGV